MLFIFVNQLIFVASSLTFKLKLIFAYHKINDIKALMILNFLKPQFLKEFMKFVLFCI